VVNPYEQDKIDDLLAFEHSSDNNLQNNLIDENVAEK